MKLLVSVIPAALTILLLGLLYLVPVGELFIFSWVSPLLMFYIQYLLSMLTPSIYLFGLFLQIMFVFTGFSGAYN